MLDIQKSHMQLSFLKAGKKLIEVTVLLLFFHLGTANAQVTFDVIGPHEYDLPVGMKKPVDIFVQYFETQRTDKMYNNNGDKVNVPKTNLTIGLTKYVRLFSLESYPEIGLAWEAIVPEIGVRNNTAGISAGGLGDPLVGPVIWYKPTPNSTLGVLALVTVPIGDSAVGGGDQWTYHPFSPFWHVNMGKFAYTGMVGFQTFGHSSRQNGKQGDILYTNHRLGYRVNDWFEPLVTLDYEKQKSSALTLSSNEMTVGLGAMFHYWGNQSLTLNYSKGVDGKNHSVNDSFHAKYVFVF
ncbi:transporter [Hydrogenophaga sp.]|uniref:transporter n=1 Tax=Hydrogenophaga sp. TaxID=1904254 RepID=UPI002732E915|nr:transporter [Hydrogenophaga sp.]MDP3325908.1 transporter [Hydrogenophaga sp.]MDP3888394.1 transporter [Hydrogenophaga sp.]